jgi:caa(3)-type oxidase subunit IV
MRSLIGTRAAVTWLMLVAATLVSFTMVETLGSGTAVAVLTMGIATVKMRLVCLDFMELRDSPIKLRLALEVFCAAMWLTLTGLYLWA